MASKKAPKSKSSALLAKAPEASKAFVSSIPIDVLLLEAAQAAKAGKKLRARLVKLPSFEIKDLDNLPALIAELTAAETIWGTLRFAAAAGRQKVASRKEAEALRSDLLGSAEFLFRKDKDASAALARIRDGEGLADLVADLHDLVKFWGAHKKVWALDESISDADFKRASELAELLGSAEDSDDAITAQEHRNQLAWLLEQRLSELRDAAGFLLRKTPRRLTPFLSRYEALRKARARRKARTEGKTPV